MNSNKTKRFLIALLGYLFVVAIGIYFRLYPLIYHTSDHAQEQATVLILTKLRAESLKEANLKSYGLTPFEKNRLGKDTFDINLRNQKLKVRKDIDQLAKKIDQKNPENISGPFLLEADPYYYYQLTQNVLKTGRISDTRRGSKYLNKRMLTPEGNWEPFNLHPYVGVLTYRLLLVFSPSIPLMKAVGFTPILIIILTTIPFLMICRKMGYPTFISLLSLAILFLSPIYAKRSAFGWYDNDPYNIFFPLMILAFLFIAMEQLSSIRKSLLWGLGISCFMSLYAFFWQGWVYTFSVLVISGLLVLLYNNVTLKEKATSGKIAIFLGSLFVMMLVGISLNFGFKDFFVLFQEGWKALKNFMTPKISLWPDLYISVGELKKSSLIEIGKLTGGLFFFLFSFLGLIFGIKRIIKCFTRTETFRFIVILTFLFFSVLITLKAQRFALLTLIPLSLLFPAGLSWAQEGFKKLISKKFPITAQKGFLPAVHLVIGLLILAPSILQLHEEMYLWRPIYNETWDNIFQEIKTKTPPDSVVNTWWPPGHFITSMAERRVTFDGATINNPQAYWLANVFLSNNERFAVGLLRMLNCHANQATAYLQKQNIPLSTSVELIKRIVVASPEENRQILEKFLNANQIETLLTLTHGEPPPSYCLIYSELFDKNLELSFVGRWNFKKIEELNNNPQQMKEIPRPNTKAFIKFLWDLVGGPWNYSETLGQIATKGTTLIFEQNIQIDLETMTCQIASEKFGKGIPQSLVYLKDNKIVKKDFSPSNLKFAVVLFQRSNHYATVVMDPRLAQSLLVKLYLFEGAGLEYFEPFARETDLTGRNQIYVYKVNWAKFLKDLNEKP